MSSSERTSQDVTSGLETDSASSRTFDSIRSPWNVNASWAPSSARRFAIAQAIERLLATPRTSPFFPSNTRRGYRAQGMRVAVVTGASSGIGAALCRELRGTGWHVVGLSRRPAPDADEHEECDVSDRGAVGAAAMRVLERHPQIDLLVN